MRTEVNDRVKEGIAQRRSENIKYRYIRKIWGVDDVRTKRQKAIYMRKEEKVNMKLVWLYMFIMKW